MQANLRRLSLKGSIIILLSGCHGYGQSGFPGNPPASRSSGLNPYPTVGAIPVPAGYHRLPAEKAPFTAWLRAIPLKKDRTVYLFDGSCKRNQDAQFAVLDVSVGHKDLQQCADAVMWLRAEFLYAQGKSDAIDFYTEQGVRLNFREWENGGRVRLSGGRLTPGTGQMVRKRLSHRNGRFIPASYAAGRKLSGGYK